MATPTNSGDRTGDPVSRYGLAKSRLLRNTQPHLHDSRPKTRQVLSVPGGSRDRTDNQRTDCFQARQDRAGLGQTAPPHGNCRSCGLLLSLVGGLVASVSAALASESDGMALSHGPRVYAIGKFNIARRPVVVHLGTNGLLDRAAPHVPIHPVHGSQDFELVTVHAPCSWVAGRNRTIRSCARKMNHSSVRVTDWHRTARTFSTLFYVDGVHLRPAGVETFVHQIQQHQDL